MYYSQLYRALIALRTRYQSPAVEDAHAAAGRHYRRPLLLRGLGRVSPDVRVLGRARQRLGGGWRA
jgi:hypothetical protein